MMPNELKIPYWLMWAVNSLFVAFAAVILGVVIALVKKDTHRRTRHNEARHGGPSMSQRFRDPNAVILVLNQIETLYRRLDEEDRADTLREVINQVESEPDVAIEYLTGVEVWGGSGSMIDLSFDPTPWLLDRTKPGFEQTCADHRYHAKLLFDLMRELELSGLFSPWFESRRKVLLRDMSW